MLTEGLPDVALNQIAEVVKATGAQQQAPELYIVLLFAGVVTILGGSVFLHYVKNRDTAFMSHIEKYGEAEDRRMAQLQTMQTNCHTQAATNLKLAVETVSECKGVIERNNSLFEQIIHKV